MRFVLIIFFLFAAFPAHAAELEKRTIVHDGITREYWVYDPRDSGIGKSDKRPLILVLHGGGGRAEKFDAMTNEEMSFNKLADREDILVAYPQGLNKNWNDGRAVSHIKTQAQDTDDAGFLSALIDTLVNARNADPKRVYAVGPSNGGHMSNRLACDLSGKVAAVGIVIGLMPKKYLDKCKPQSPVSVLIMNGTEDPLVPFNGGFVRLFKNGRDRGEDISTEDTFAFWLKHAGYGGNSEAIAAKHLPDADPGDKTRVTLRAYKGGQSQVALYTIVGGGHTWPGGRQYFPESLVGRVSHDINATEVIWDFFKNAAQP